MFFPKTVFTLKSWKYKWFSAGTPFRLPEWHSPKAWC